MAERTRFRAACTTRRSGQALRAALAVVMSAFAASMRDIPIAAVIAGLVAVTAAAGAVTGWCPADLLSRRVTTGDDASGGHGFPEALQHIELS